LALLLKPSPATFIADSFALGAVGIWNLSIAILALLGGYFFNNAALLGVVRIYWGIHNYKRYKKISLMPKPAADVAKRLDDLVLDVYRAQPKMRPNIIQFQIANFRERQKWKARLCDDVAIFVKGNRQDGVFAERGDIEIVPQKESLGGDWKASFRMRGRTGKGTISQEHYQRFKEWFEAEPPQLPEESTLAPQDAPAQAE